MRVESYGSGSPALVFIPGLACGSWVWDDAVRAYAGTHAVYVVTLAGFDGFAAVPGASLDRADASLLELVAKLDRPIVIGHSLGGFLALRFGTEHAKLVRGIVSVDGLPVFPTPAEGPKAATATPGERAESYRAFYASLLAGAPNARVVTIADSLHFAMIDRPKATYAAITEFVDALAR